MTQLLPDDVLCVISHFLILKTVKLVNKCLLNYNKIRYCQNLLDVTQDEIKLYTEKNNYCVYSSDGYEIVNSSSKIVIFLYSEHIRTPFDHTLISIYNNINNYKFNFKSKIDLVSQIQIYKNRSTDSIIFNAYKKKLLNQVSSHLLAIYNHPHILAESYVWLVINHFMIEQLTNDIDIGLYFKFLDEIIINNNNAKYYRTEAKQLYDKMITLIENL